MACVCAYIGNQRELQELSIKVKNDFRLHKHSTKGFWTDLLTILGKSKSIENIELWNESKDSTYDSCVHLKVINILLSKSAQLVTLKINEISSDEATERAFKLLILSHKSLQNLKLDFLRLENPDLLEIYPTLKSLHLSSRNKIDYTGYVDNRFSNFPETWSYQFGISN